jgi:hypothetical protein
MAAIMEFGAQIANYKQIVLDMKSLAQFQLLLSFAATESFGVRKQVLN